MPVPLAGTDLYRGSAPVKIRHTGTPAAGTVVWALYNNDATKIVVPTRLFLRCFFDGVAANTLMRFEVVKGITVSGIVGGTDASVVHKKTGLSAKRTSLAKFADAGITLTGFALQGLLAEISMTRGITMAAASVWAESRLDLDWPSIQLGQLELAVQEVVAIRLVNQAVVGDNIIGHCEFSEKAA